MSDTIIVALIGLAGSGLGAFGGVVDYHGTLYRCTVDGNIWSPADYPQGWEPV